MGYPSKRRSLPCTKNGAKGRAYVARATSNVAAIPLRNGGRRIPEFVPMHPAAYGQTPDSAASTRARYLRLTA